MSPIRRGPWIAGLLTGLSPFGGLAAQDLPEPLPPPPTIAPVPPTAVQSPRVIPAPRVVEVAPGGPQPTWMREPLDPVAVQKHAKHHVKHKSRSWLWRRLQGKFSGYPEEYTPRPLGAALYDQNRMMVANGAAAKLVLYEYDFEPGTSRLKPRGRDQLARITAQLAASPYPLIIERTPDDPSLADARRMAVLAELAAGPLPIPAERVLVGMPISRGMSGNDADIISANALQRTRLYGPPIPINSNGVNSPGGVTNPVSGVMPGQ
jgi:hypothetical protein